MTTADRPRGQRRAVSKLKDSTSPDPKPGGLGAETVEDLIASEHAIVRQHLGHMRVIAEAAPTEIPLTLRNRLDAVFSFLHNDVLPHMRLEEESVYEAVDRIPDGPHSMAAMVIDHEVIRRLIGELDHLAGPRGWKRWRAELQPRLLVLEAVMRFHVEKEERLYGPFLDQIEPTAAASVRARLLEHSVQHGHAPWGFSAHPRP